jgi:phosphopantothenoylcysteine decarboxylase/phosphopantothenate--cysteine ligase
MRVTLIVTGSIAAYKSAELVRALKKQGLSVRVVMTESAKEFITPLTLQTLSGEEVASDMFSLHEESRIGHIRLADEADVILVAPATANFIAKAANGIADDLASTIYLATKARIVLAPAMNVNMWEHAATQENLAKLKARGVEVVSPGSGKLACGWEGKGRMAEVDQIIAAILPGKALADEVVVVTAGPTREPIDAVRYISNGSSGRMGVALAEAARRRGAKVVLLTGPGVYPYDLSFSSALDLREKLSAVLADYSNVTLFMAAAPVDYRMENPSADKIKSDKTRETTLRLIPNPDIVGEIGQNREAFPGLKRIIAFCAESVDGEELIQRARIKLLSKGADFIVANSVSESMGGEFSRVYLLGREPGEAEFYGSKTEVAARLIEAVFSGSR